MPEFRLATLLRLRQRERDSSRIQFAQALRATHEVQERIHAVEQEQKSTLDELRDQSAVGIVSLATLQRLQDYTARLSSVLAELSAELNAKQTLLAEARQELSQAEQQVRLLEKMRERQLAEDQRKHEHQEQLAREEAWSNLRRE